MEKVSANVSVLQIWHGFGRTDAELKNRTLNVKY